MAIATDIIEYFTVQYQAVGTIDDSIEDSDDIPEKVDITGWITFEANLRKGRGIQYLSAQPRPFELFPLKRRVRVANGRLDHNGTGYVKLEAASLFGLPLDWTWRVSFDLASPHGKIPVDSFNIPAVPGTVVDLTSVAPVGGSTGAPITLGPYPIAIRVSGENLVLDLSNGASLPPVRIEALADLDTAVTAAETSRQGAVEGAALSVTATELARGYRDAAQAARDAAVGARDTALGAATTATALAGQASTSAATATAAASTATGARDIATAARDAAQSARDTAVAARGDAVAARDTTLGYRDTALQHRDAAQSARAGAELARDQAVAGVVPDNGVSTGKIVDGAVTTAKIGDGQVTLAKLAANSVDSAKIVDGSIATGDLGDGQVTLAKLAANSVDSSKIVDGAIVDADVNGSAAIAFSKLAGVPFEMIIVHSAGTRKAGSGDLVVGEPVPRACTIDSVLYQFGTNDASGSTSVELRRNNATVTGTPRTITVANQSDGTATDAARTATATGNNVFAQNDRLSVYASAVGTTPGKVLKAVIRGRYT